MRIASCIIGLVGSLAGLGLQIRLYIQDWQEFPPGTLGTVVLMIAVAMLLVLSGVAGAVLVRKKPVLGGILMAVSGGIGLPLLPGYSVCGPVLLLAAILAFVAAAVGRRARTGQARPGKPA